MTSGPGLNRAGVSGVDGTHIRDPQEDNVPKLPTLAAATLLAAVGTIAIAPAASAHDALAQVVDCSYQGAIRCGYGGITNSHTRVYSCDTFGDGYGFRTEWRTRSGGGGGIDDANGSSSGCSSKTPGTAANPITIFRACQKTPNWECTNWMNA
ncbi:hypothetical protein [Amycolatopsis sp. NBC_01286]|uniref:hypothetical protein n=1 Tax=Amycolatopsis sp. NBC_01286 TaxID=2903560 RepID=UPI002E11DB1C|nr:hypothetical protein OG570_38260 [Amycolatopsis sp. NBC_01286]